MQKKQVYSDNDISRIVASYRKPLLPVKIRNKQDLKRSEVGILLSYYLQSEKPDTQTLSEIIKTPEVLEKKLNSQIINIDEEPLPKLPIWVDYDSDPEEVLISVTNNSNKFVYVNRDEIHVADTESKKFVFPNGQIINYNMLKNEVSANRSVFDFGYGDAASKKVFLSQQFFNIINILFEAAKYSEEIQKYKNYFQKFPEYMTAIPLAHEIIETAKAIKKIGPQEGIKRELFTESQTPDFLEKKGISKGYYFLLHALKMGKNEKEKLDVSYNVMKKHGL